MPHASPTSNARPDVRIGHVHLKVSDLARSIAFYRDVIGLEVQRRYGTQAAFLGANGYHHHIGLNTWESAGQDPAPARHPGLYHTAFLFPTRQDLARAIQRVIDAGLSFDGAADHGVSEALYLSDPDGNGVELYRDYPENQWPRDESGMLKMGNAPLDLDAIMATLASDPTEAVT